MSTSVTEGSVQQDSLAAFLREMESRAPGYADLLLARTDEEFEAAFDRLLNTALRALERSAPDFCESNERALSAFIGSGLRMPGINVTPEGNSRGHADLLIEVTMCRPERIKLAEAKIYDGIQYHILGLEQLLQRYSAGSESRGLLLEFVKKKNIKGLMLGLRTDLDQRLPFNQLGPCKDSELIWSFLTVHHHDSGEDIEVAHIGCNLHVTQKEELKKAEGSSG